MEKINCLNCGSIEDFSVSEKRCSECNCKNYGYNINNLPPIFNKQSTSYKNEILDKKNNVKGYLIVHTENKKRISFKIENEIVYIGRKDESFQPHVYINDDKYISRGHANILIQNNNFFLQDNQNNQTGKPSLNGTFLNGNPKRINSSQSVQIFDGDTIQIGETKLVFMTLKSISSENEAISKVSEMNYEQTIIIR